MISLTPRQRELLDYLRGHQDASYDEMATALGLRSKCNIGGWLKHLEERGYIRRRRCRGGYSCARAIEVLGQPIVIRGERYRFIPKDGAA